MFAWADILWAMESEKKNAGLILEVLHKIIPAFL